MIVHVVFKEILIGSTCLKLVLHSMDGLNSEVAIKV